MARAKKIKGWVVEGVMEKIDAGTTTIEEVEARNPDLAAAINKRRRKSRREEYAIVSIEGEAVRDTEKAVLFRVAGFGIHQPHAGREVWLPKSLFRIDGHQATGPQWKMDQILAA